MQSAAYKADMSHDFHRDGARTVRRWKLAGWSVWIEESAAWHAFGSAYYGASLNRAPRWRCLTIAAGRFSLNVAKSGAR